MTDFQTTAGPLAGLTVIEMAGLGPTPFCGMLLGDMGADVIRIDRTGPSDLGIEIPPAYELRNRNKKSVALDLKSEAGKAALLRLIAKADILLEGFRPGVAERLGIGPEDCLRLQPRLVYARATGWGQDGPLAQSAGHDINYIALTGALSMIGDRGVRPQVPLNILGDYAGGALFMAFGIVCAVLEAKNSGQGQVVDATMMDGVGSLLTVFHGFQQSGLLHPRGENVLDGGAPYYCCYETSDGGWMAVGAIESKFYVQFVELLGLDVKALPARNDTANWPRLTEIFAAEFAKHPRAHWQAVYEGTDACVSPVLSLEEAKHHPHVQARSMFVKEGEIEHPRPAPRLSRTPGTVRSNAPAPGGDTAEVLKAAGFSEAEIEKMVAG